MAWIAVGNGRILGLAFSRDSLASGPDIEHREIDDARAVDIMNGKLSMQNAISDPPPVAPSTVPATAARHWSTRYPAMMSERDVDALIALAATIPSDAIGVETGSRLGGSTKILLDNASSIKRLYSIDPEWGDPNSPGMGDPYMADLSRHWNVAQYGSCYEYAKQLLSGYNNVRLLTMDSPYGMKDWWTEQIDFIYEDSMHSNPQLRDTFEFWVPLVRSGGIIAGHDYGTSWTDVVTEVDSLAARLGTVLQRQGTVWWMIKP